MRITWSGGAGRRLDELSPDRRRAIESEMETMFSDAVPGDSVSIGSGMLMVELPCGVEVDFERMGDGVRILFLGTTVEDGLYAARHTWDSSRIDPSAKD